MKTELSKIAQDLEQGTITEHEARTLLFGLLGATGSLIMKVEQMEFIPEVPYSSNVISWEIGNIWELHELFPDSQKIEIRINKNYR